MINREIPYVGACSQANDCDFSTFSGAQIREQARSYRGLAADKKVIIFYQKQHDRTVICINKQCFFIARIPWRNRSIEEMLLQVALHGTAQHVEQLVRKYRRAEKVSDRKTDASNYEARELTCFFDEDGMLVIRGRLTPEDGAVFMSALVFGGKISSIGTCRSEPARDPVRPQERSTGSSHTTLNRCALHRRLSSLFDRMRQLTFPTLCGYSPTSVLRVALCRCSSCAALVRRW